MWFIFPLRMGFRFYLSHLFTQSYLVSHRSLHHIYPVGTVLLHFFNFLWSSSSQSCCIFSIFLFFVVIQLPLLCFPWVVLRQINLLYIVTDFLINKIVFQAVHNQGIMLFASQQTEQSMILSLTTTELLYHLLPGFSCFVAPFDLKLGISGHVFQFHFSLYNLKSSCTEFSVMFNGTTSATLAVAYISVQVIYKTHATPSSYSTSSWV